MRAHLSRQRVLPLILVATGALMLGCRRPAPLDSPDPTLPALSTAAGKPTEPATPEAAADVSTPVPTGRSPATQTPATRTAEPTEEPTPPSDRSVSPTVGARAPGLTLPDLDGQEVSLSGLKGNAVLLNFWTTW